MYYTFSIFLAVLCRTEGAQPRSPSEPGPDELLDARLQPFAAERRQRARQPRRQSAAAPGQDARQRARGRRAAGPGAEARLPLRDPGHGDLQARTSRRVQRARVHL